jgi:hypothetical protein
VKNVHDVKSYYGNNIPPLFQNIRAGAVDGEEHENENEDDDQQIHVDDRSDDGQRSQQHQQSNNKNDVSVEEYVAAMKEKDFKLHRHGAVQPKVARENDDDDNNESGNDKGEESTTSSSGSYNQNEKKRKRIPPSSTSIPNDADEVSSSSQDSASTSTTACDGSEGNGGTNDEDDSVVGVKAHHNSNKKSNAVGDPDGDDDDDDDEEEQDDEEDVDDHLSELSEDWEDMDDEFDESFARERTVEPQVQVEVEVLQKELEDEQKGDYDEDDEALGGGPAASTKSGGGVGVRLNRVGGRRRSNNRKDAWRSTASTSTTLSQDQSRMIEAWVPHVYFPPTPSALAYLSEHARIIDASSKNRLDRRTLYAALLVEWGADTKLASQTRARKFLPSSTSQALQAALSLATQPKWRKSAPRTSGIRLYQDEDPTKGCTLGMQETVAMALVRSLLFSGHVNPFVCITGLVHCSLSWV